MPREKKQHLKQRKDGRYCCVYQGIQFMGRTEEEALSARKEYRDALERQEIIEKDLTVFEYAYNWLPIHKASVAVNTYNAYKNYLNTLVKQIGSIPMKDVTPSDIKGVYNIYLGSSESTIRKARMLYVDMWDCAIEDKIVRSNPCRTKGAQPHEGTSGTHRALSKDEDDLILNAPADLRLGVLLMRYAGIRRGELMALDIDRDIDFDRKIINITRAIHFEGNHGVVSDPKTEAGRREIPLLDILEKELRGHHGTVCPPNMTRSIWRNCWEHYKNQLERQINGVQRGWFHRTKEWIMDHPKEWEYYMKLKRKDPNAAEEYRLKEWRSVTIRPHDLRHSYCTMLRDNGVDIKLAIRWMGHADEKMILKIYDHPPEDRIKKAIKNLNQSLIHMQNDMQTADQESRSIENT